MLHLITGTPGSGKTLYAVSLLDKYRKDNLKLLNEGKEPRPLYADIDGLEMDGVEPAPDDWRDTPDGSVIFYDEIQQRDVYKKQKNDNDIVNDLQIHRHTGHDIYGITQFPVLLHNNFKAVVGLHYHLHRGWGLQASTVYQWAHCIDSPNSPSNKRLAEHDFRFSFPKELFNVYKSATQHTHKRRIPKKFLAVVFAIPIMIFIVFKLLSGDNIITKVAGAKDAKDVEQATSSPIDNTSASASIQSDNVDQPIYQQPVDGGYYDPLTAGYIADVNLVPVSAVSFGGSCRAYNKQGNLLTHITESDCKRYLSTAGMLPKLPRAESVAQQPRPTTMTTTTTTRDEEAAAEELKEVEGV